MAASSSTTPDIVSLTIGGRAWKHWDDLEVHLSFDSHASVGFSAPFEVEREEFRKAFRPLSFAPVDIAIDGDALFTGYMVDVIPTTGPERRKVDVSAYSKPAILDDTDVPVSLLPVQATGLTLRQIAQRLCSAHGISVVLQGEDGSAFGRVKTRRTKINATVEADEKIGEFLVELAKQRGFVRSSTAKGELLFWKSAATGRPVAHLEHGRQPLIDVVPTFDPQSYFSEVTGFTTAKRGRLATKHTERVQRIGGGILRAHSFKLNDVEKGDAANAVKAKVGRMLANVVTYVVNVPAWRDPKGALWKPNTTLTLKAPDAMVYAPTELLIRDVYLKQSSGERTASLGLVLPGSFSGEVPSRMPWEDP